MAAEAEHQLLETTVEELKHLFSPRVETGDTVILNMGPQHPSTHGVLRLIVELDGEIMANFEMIAGKRMMTSYFRPGGIWRDVPAGFEEAVRDFLNYLPPRLDEYESLLTNNPIWLDRTKDIGVIDGPTALAWGLTGPS